MQKRWLDKEIRSQVGNWAVRKALQILVITSSLSLGKDFIFFKNFFLSQVLTWNLGLADMFIRWPQHAKLLLAELFSSPLRTKTAEHLNLLRIPRWRNRLTTPLWIRRLISTECSSQLLYLFLSAQFCGSANLHDLFLMASLVCCSP